MRKLQEFRKRIFDPNINNYKYKSNQGRLYKDFAIRGVTQRQRRIRRSEYVADLFVGKELNYLEISNEDFAEVSKQDAYLDGSINEIKQLIPLEAKGKLKLGEDTIFEFNPKKSWGFMPTHYKNFMIFVEKFQDSITGGHVLLTSEDMREGSMEAAAKKDTSRTIFYPTFTVFLFIENNKAIVFNSRYQKNFYDIKHNRKNEVIYLEIKDSPRIYSETISTSRLKRQQKYIYEKWNLRRLTEADTLAKNNVNDIMLYKNNFDEQLLA